MPQIYLNNAATSWPKPASVLRAVTESLELPVFGSGRTSGTEGKDYSSLARESVASLIHSDKEQIVFTQNATDSLNILINGFLKLNKGAHVITTALDHNSVLRPLFEHRKAGDITLDVAGFEDGKVNPDTIFSLIRPDTKLVVMSNASNVIGSLQDVRAVSEILSDKGIFFVVDGAQTAGHIPLDVDEIGCDAFVFTGHKALLGIAGVGGFYLKDGERGAQKIAPTRFGGTGSYSNELYQPSTLPDKFECGTQNVTGLAALHAGIEYIKSRGIHSIHQQGVRQSREIVCSLKSFENIRVHYETPDVPVISFEIEGLPSDDVGFILSRAYNIITRTGLHCAPLAHQKLDDGRGSVRLSLSCFTTDDECKVATTAIGEIAENAASGFHST